MLDRKILISKVTAKIAGAFLDQNTKRDLPKLAEILKKSNASNLKQILGTWCSRKNLTAEQIGLVIDKLGTLYQVAATSPDHKQVLNELYKANEHVTTRIF